MSTYTNDNAGLWQKEIHLYGSSRLGIYNLAVNLTNPVPIATIQVGDIIGKKYIFTRGQKFFELSNHLGNVLVTISDRKTSIANTVQPTLVSRYRPIIVNAQDYLSFGAIMTGRSYTAPNGGYRYGFNGKENDNEVKGSGNQQDYGMRIYDPRLGRFLSVDPLTQEYPWYTPYQFSGNSPILFIDRDGEEPERNKKSPGLPEIYGRSIALKISNSVTNHYASTQRRFWFLPVKEPELKGRYVCGPGTGFISDTRQEKARLLNMFVGTTTQFFVDESNASEYKDFEAAVNYSIIKGFVTGSGPENLVFPRNGIISSTFLKSDVLKDALQNYLVDPDSQYGPEQSEFGITALGKDAFRNRSLFGSVTGLVGSAEITVTKNNNGINIDIFNVTSITSAAFGKEFYKAIFGDFGEKLFYPRSYVREPGATTEFGNVSQRFSLFIPFNTEGDKFSNIKQVIEKGSYEDK